LTFTAGRRQGVPLQVKVLIVGRYPRIAYFHFVVRLSVVSAIIRTMKKRRKKTQKTSARRWPVADLPRRAKNLRFTETARAIYGIALAYLTDIF
jgi:hypothetical protein